MGIYVRGGCSMSGKYPFNNDKSLQTVFYFPKKETSFPHVEIPKQGSLITFGPEAPLRIS